MNFEISYENIIQIFYIIFMKLTTFYYKRQIDTLSIFLWDMSI